MAAQFINAYLEIGGVVAFVLPITFRKWAGQAQVRADARLIADWTLPDRAFELPNGRPYRLPCCFQIWSTRGLDKHNPDLRLPARPRESHPDFGMWTATKVDHPNWSRDWSFATFCQGGGRYRERFYPGYSPSNTRRHMLFRAAPRVLTRLEGIDFDALSRGWGTVRGFHFAEVVAAYEQLSDSEVAA